MFLAFSYPFMKRITYWPQLFLGITFNWGIIMAWTAINNGISLEIIILYVSAIFWTLGYDTIYGAQDVSDDEIIGIKSTSIKFKNNIIMFVTICYVLTFISLAFLLRNNFGLNITTILFVIFNLSLLNQILNLKDLKKNNFLKIFKSNNTSGLILFFAILTTNL
jgi:4-hydroxybenzoate polyprenyl transferase